MTYKYDSVYIKDAYTIGGEYEKNGPLSRYFDKLYSNDFYFGEKSVEKAEKKLLSESINSLIKRNKLNENEVDVLVSGDLQNQISASNYAARDFDIPFLGIFSACSTCSEGLIIASTLIDSKKIKKAIVSTSSHNLVSEKQFRNPSEYGTPKPKTSTFTVTGAASILLTNKKDKIKVESSTIGRVVDLGINDVNNMGAVMAPAAADTIYRHLSNLKRDVNYYDLILTGDLGAIGKEILIDYMYKKYKIDLSKNYNDCGTMIYDTKGQPVYAGASGPACSALVNFGYIMKLMQEGKLNRVLIVPTGAVFSPTNVFQKETIPSISHAVSLEAIK